MTPEERQKMIEDNMPLVGYALNLLEYDKSNYQDYFQQGCLQLIRCVDNYKPESGRKFSTYAVKNIKWFLKDFIQRDKVVKPPTIGITGRVRRVSIDSLDRVISADGEKEITLGDVIPDEGEKEISDIELCLHNLEEEEIINEVEKQIFINRIVYNEAFRNLKDEYGVTVNQAKKIISKVSDLLREEYSLMFPDMYEAQVKSYNKK